MNAPDARTRAPGLYLVALTLWLAACGATPTSDDTSSTVSERTLAPGTFVINPQFDSALSFSEGLAAVRIGDKKWTPKPGQRLKWNLHRVSGRRAEAGCAEVHHIWRPPTK